MVHGHNAAELPRERGHPATPGAGRLQSDADYERLSAIKAAHDPRNLFRINHNIPPSGGASADGIVDPRSSRQVGSEEGAG